MLPDIKNILLETAMPFPDKTIISNKNNEIKNITHCVDLIIPGIYHSSDGEEFWTSENLRSRGLTNIIRIDKHKSFINPSNNQSFIKYPTVSSENKESFHSNQHFKLDLCKEIDILDLNFGEETYITTVLPNCYKAVKFIKKTLQNCGAILIIDYNNDQQKFLTIVTAYLMYKNNLNYKEAFQKLQKNYKEAELDGFFIRQLYEYEPILQVQKAQARGNSSSREQRSSVLKRKKCYENRISSNNCSNTGDFIGDILME